MVSFVSTREAKKSRTRESSAFDTRPLPSADTDNTQEAVISSAIVHIGRDGRYLRASEGRPSLPLALPEVAAFVAQRRLKTDFQVPRRRRLRSPCLPPLRCFRPRPPLPLPTATTVIIKLMQGGSRGRNERGTERIRTRKEGEAAQCKNNKREDAAPANVLSSHCSLRQFMLSQARRGFLLHFFVWADEIVAYLSQSSATAPDLLPSVSFQRTDLKECGSGGETGNFYSNRHVTAH